MRAGGLDYVRLVRKLDDLLDAKRVALYQGEACGIYDDGSVQVRAAELLAELLGLRKGQLDLNVSSDPDSGLTVVINQPQKPDADRTPSETG